MSALYREYLEVADFGSYEDFLRNYRINVPENFNFAYDVLDRIAREEPDKRALVWHTPEGETKEFTFADISRQSDRVAAMLTRMGVKKGDKIMLVLKRHYSFWYTIMALHKIGAVTVPATNLLTKKDIVYRAHAADIKGVIATGHGSFPAYMEEALPDCPTVEFLMMVGDTREGWLSFEEELEKPAEPFAPAQRPTCNDDILLLYFTSGTSGMPKMVAHDYTYPLGHIQTAVFWHQCQENGLHLTVAETGWAKSVWGKLYGQWLAGCAVMAYDFDKFVPREILEVIQKFGITSFCAPPTIYRFMMTEEMEQYDLSSLKHCTIAGEALNPDVYQQWLRRTGIEMRECYGQTELCVTVCTFPWMKVNPGSMGKPSPMFDIDIIDEEGNSCPPGVVGEMVIRTRRGRPIGMYQGYYREQERTDSVWHDGLYHTLDLAWRDEWGYYWYVGRADDVIKSSGYRIGPFEVESALMEHPAVLETAITGVPDPVRGQIVKATIVLNKGFEPSDALKKELFNLKFQHSTNQLENPQRIVAVKKDIARVMTLIREAQLNGQNS